MNMLKLLRQRDSFSKALIWAVGVGLATILLVLTMKKSGNIDIWALAYNIGNQGNDLFLILTNLLIIGWALNKRWRSIIYLTLTLDAAVWAVVQGVKALHLTTEWAYRPNGGAGGFPSGHATHAFAMAFLLTLFFPRLAWLWYGCAAVISWSRVESDWHTGFQVTVGVVLGIGTVLLLVGRWLKHPDAAQAIGRFQQGKPAVQTDQKYVIE
ncbi:MAG TPA: phosphatase PAP2 family protein [Methylomusa anaerophila]|uniref:PAP2 superfamily protein n=1 Tax=Methylomusa anaerophila TaxID=1930071 RepID=A0A348ALD2_9FIRM|nr:phosphatase PAP2 family protein [Methylomusa anaerophila]BBB91880.1 PAP2 superfamily protein [Methylomusa anaerophila]HML88389.1 phosphatase PAP2 family protein [Methylomusa anaerophila]